MSPVSNRFPPTLNSQNRHQMQCSPAPPLWRCHRISGAILTALPISAEALFQPLLPNLFSLWPRSMRFRPSPKPSLSLGSHQTFKLKIVNPYNWRASLNCSGWLSVLISPHVLLYFPPHPLSSHTGLPCGPQTLASSCLRAFARVLPSGMRALLPKYLHGFLPLVSSKVSLQLINSQGDHPYPYIQCTSQESLSLCFPISLN